MATGGTPGVMCRGSVRGRGTTSQMSSGSVGSSNNNSHQPLVKSQQELTDASCLTWEEGHEDVEETPVQGDPKQLLQVPPMIQEPSEGRGDATKTKRFTDVK